MNDLSANSLSSRAQQALHKAQQQYRQGLADRGRQLLDLLHQHQNTAAQNTDGDEYKVEILHRLHQLGGSAGLYELTELSTRAKNVYRCISEDEHDAVSCLEELAAYMVGISGKGESA